MTLSIIVATIPYSYNNVKLAVAEIHYTNRQGFGCFGPNIRLFLDDCVLTSTLEYGILYSRKTERTLKTREPKPRLQGGGVPGRKDPRATAETRTRRVEANKRDKNRIKSKGGGIVHRPVLTHRWRSQVRRQKCEGNTTQKENEMESAMIFTDLKAAGFDVTWNLNGDVRVSLNRPVAMMEVDRALFDAGFDASQFKTSRIQDFVIVEAVV